MVVCKFFQQGNCRYGRSCRFEHVYGSKYNYYAKAPAQYHSQPFGELDEKLATQNTSFETNATSIFRNAVQSTSAFSQNNVSMPSIFSNNINATNPSAVFAQANIFGSQNQPNHTLTIFGQPEASNAKSFFAQASEYIFGRQPVQNLNVLNNASNASNIFASASRSVFGQNVGSTIAPFENQMDTNLYQRPDSSNIFGQNSFQQISYDSGFYSKMEDLIEDDLEAFKREKFELGFVPEVPPPQSLCI